MHIIKIYIREFIDLVVELEKSVYNFMHNPSDLWPAVEIYNIVDQFIYHDLEDKHKMKDTLYEFFGEYFYSIIVFMDAIQMIANERVYGFYNLNENLSEEQMIDGVIYFKDESEFQIYTKAEMSIAYDFTGKIVLFLKKLFHKLQLHDNDTSNYVLSIDSIIKWTRKIAKETRGDELIFERYLMI